MRKKNFQQCNVELEIAARRTTVLLTAYWVNVLAVWMTKSRCTNWLRSGVKTSWRAFLKKLILRSSFCDGACSVFLGTPITRIYHTHFCPWSSPLLVRCKALSEKNMCKARRTVSLLICFIEKMKNKPCRVLLGIKIWHRNDQKGGIELRYLEIILCIGAALHSDMTSNVKNSIIPTMEPLIVESARKI